MPTYSYRCTECGKAFDVQQSFTDSSLTVCPNCGGMLRKVFSPIGVSFTGSGFYRNDSRAAPAEKKGVAETKSTDSPVASPPTNATSSTSSDKPATAAKPAAASSPSKSGSKGRTRE